MDKNWFNRICSGKPPVGKIELALRAQTVISLAEMSHRLNVACLFDERSRKITTGPDSRVLEPSTYGALANSQFPIYVGQGTFTTHPRDTNSRLKPELPPGRNQTTFPADG